MRLADKTIIQQTFGSGRSLQADFVLPEIEATVRDKGLDVILEKVYLCPCKDSGTPAPLNLCQNCGGVGWFWANPTKTKMLISGIAADGKLKEAALREWGMVDGGTVKVTALDDNKFSYMDKIVLLDSTAEHNQILYPKLTDDDSTVFAFTQYDILEIDFIGFFNRAESKITKLNEISDYTFNNNIIRFASGYRNITNLSVTIRYSHRPVLHIIDILRESMTSTKGAHLQGQQKLLMPVHALAKRAHLIKDIENYDGDRLLDNSWLPDACQTEALTKFQRQLKYTPVSEIYSNLTPQQITDLDVLIHS